MIHWPELTYLNVDINAHTTCNPHYVKFSCRLAKSSPIWRLNLLSYI